MSRHYSLRGNRLRHSYVIREFRLIKENTKRCDNDYYEYRLEEIKKVFEVEIHGEKNTMLAEEYKEALKSEIQIIAKVLQEVDLEYDYEPINDSADYNYIYPNQLIFEPEKGLLEWAIGVIKNPLGNYVDFDSTETIEEIQVLVKAGWWKYGQKKMKDEK